MTASKWGHCEPSGLIESYVYVEGVSEVQEDLREKRQRCLFNTESHTHGKHYKKVQLPSPVIGSCVSKLQSTEVGALNTMNLVAC